MALLKFLNSFFLLYLNRKYWQAIILIIFFIALPSNVRSAELAEIEARGNLIVGIKDNLRPLGYRDQNGNLAGLEIDIAHRLAEELLGDKEAIEFIPVLNQNRLEIVIEDEVDLVIASVTMTPSRQRLVNFSDYYFLTDIGIIVAKNSLPINLYKFQGKIGVLKNSRAIDELKYNLPELQLTSVISYQQASTLMEKGEIQGFAGDITVLTGWTQQNPQYKLLDNRWGGYPLAIVLPKGRQYQSLRDRVNQIIRQLKQEGWLEERAKFWGLAMDKN